MRSKKYGLKAIAALVSSAMLFSAVGLFPLNSSAICCRKDGFDKSRYTLTGNMAEDVAIIAKSQKGRWCDDFGYSGVDRGAWCDEFVADCIENAGADSSIVGHGGTVADFESVMRKKGAYDVSNPQVGDLIFFTKSHVEIVTKVENGIVYCAGGNNAAPGSKYKSPGCCAGERKASTVGTTRLFLRPAYTPPPPPTKPSPQWATLSVNSIQLPVNDLLEFSATSDDANVFYLNIDKDFERLYCEKMTDGKYSIKLSEPGYYTACVTAWNEGGWVDSEYIGFTVVAPPTSASLMTENYITNYNVNDTVTFLASSDNAEVCFLNIDKDNKRLYCEEMTDGKYSIKLSEPGYYTACVTARNIAGWVDSEYIGIRVLKPADLGDERYVYIKSAANNLFMTRDDTNVVGKLTSKNEEQLWWLKKQADGSYRIKSAYNNSCMEVFQAGTTNGTNISTYEFTPEFNNQSFFIYELFGAYYIKPLCSDLFVDMSFEESNNVATYGYSDNWDHQKFEFIDWVKGDLNIDGKVTVADIVSLNKWLLGNSDELKCWQNADLCADGVIDVFDMVMLRRLLIEKGITK